MNEIYLLTGGNMGDRLHLLHRANDEIERLVGRVIKKSAIYETAPWGFGGQGLFLNQVLCVEADITASSLLQKILGIERELGRVRVEKMGPRVIDIDILFYGSDIISETELIVPHPRIAERRFVLTPLSEIAPDLLHPIYQKTVRQLLQECPDELEVHIFEK